jgi:hypothetical protein
MPDGKTHQMPVHFDATKTALGRGISGTLGGKTPGGQLEAAFLIGFDPLDKSVRFMVVSSDDEIHDHRCTLKDARVTCEPRRTTSDGKPATEDVAFSFEPAGTLTFTSVETRDDGKKVSFEGKAKK